MKGNINISICVPAFNEEMSIEGSVKDLVVTLASRVQELEVIIVNDGSTDATQRLAEQLAKQYKEVKVIHHKRNLGIGVCYRDALTIAQGNYFTWFPADHENSADEFIQCLPHLDEATVVTCHHRGHDPRSPLRRRLSYSYTWILNKHFHLDLKYYNGLSVFPISILRKLTLVTEGFFFNAENLILAIHYGCRIIELSAPLKKLAFRKSKAFTFVSICLTVKDFLRILRIRKVKFNNLNL